MTNHIIPAHHNCINFLALFDFTAFPRIQLALSSTATYVSLRVPVVLHGECTQVLNEHTYSKAIIQDIIPSSIPRGSFATSHEVRPD